MIERSAGEVRCPAFQLYAADFIAGTQEMSQAEVGAYIRLLCQQWTRGSIPSCPDKRERLAGGPVSPDVLAKFPAAGDGQLKNLRLEEYRDNLEFYRQRKVDAGRSGADKRWGRKQNDSTAIPEPWQKDGTAMNVPLAEAWQEDGYSPSSSSSTPTTTTTPEEGCGESSKEERKKESLPEGFEEFWKAYPRKVAKPQAIRAWRKLNPNQELRNSILNDVKARSSSQAWTKDNGTFIPYPATYLNNQRWEDSAPASAANPVTVTDLETLYKQAKFKVETHACHHTFGYKKEDLPQQMWDAYAQLKATAAELKAKLESATQKAYL